MPQAQLSFHYRQLHAPESSTLLTITYILYVLRWAPIGATSANRKSYQGDAALEAAAAVAILS